MLYKKAENIDLLLIKIFLFITPFLFGLYFEFASYFAQIIILVILLIKLCKAKKCKIYLNFEAIALAVISAGYLFTCIYAIDKGMAILGFLKFTIPLTFGLMLMQYEKQEITEYLKVIPVSGIIMIILSMLFKYISFLPNDFYLPNGRMMGFLQYANTFALFLLIGIIFTVYCIKDKKKVIIYNIILLFGILISGCRTVLVLAFLNYIIAIVKKKELRIYFIALVLIAIAGTITYVLITGNLNTIGRYLTISVASRSLQERLLYYKDAIPLILKYPFGMGYMGYSYIQPQIQTGIYQAAYVHNDFLQLILDIGIIPTIIFGVAMAKSIISKNNSKSLKLFLLTIALHILLDFDLQFLIIFLILVISLDIWSGKEFEFEVSKMVVIVTGSIFIAIYLYFALTTFFHYIEKDEISAKMYLIYTEANIAVANNYMESEDIENANEVATNMKKTNKELGMIYNIKAYYYLKNQKWNLMEQNKKRYLEINKYDMSEYEDYILMLSQAIEYYAKNDEMEKAMDYIKQVVEVPSIIEKVKSSTSNIAYELKEVPNFELKENVQKYILTMKGVLEND
ncbi:MAG: O-antigen ligase family protein [Clostridia bacterium]|nr:O-antigen ligase family protein [Clostridia bacterium]